MANELLLLPLAFSALVLLYIFWPRRAPTYTSPRVTRHHNGQRRHWGE